MTSLTTQYYNLNISTNQPIINVSDKIAQKTYYLLNYNEYCGKMASNTAGSDQTPVETHVGTLKASNLANEDTATGPSTKVAESDETFAEKLSDSPPPHESGQDTSSSGYSAGGIATSASQKAQEGGKSLADQLSGAAAQTSGQGSTATTGNASNTGFLSNIADKAQEGGQAAAAQASAAASNVSKQVNNSTASGQSNDGVLSNAASKLQETGQAAANQASSAASNVSQQVDASTSGDTSTNNEGIIASAAATLQAGGQAVLEKVKETLGVSVAEDGTLVTQDGKPVTEQVKEALNLGNKPNNQ
ncbi:hypothetical protein ACHAQA_001585 [Verticillium albo-atrum]